MESLTVFTPAYNRAHTLGRTYKSLCAQSNKDFIWMVVDDGSTDHTRQLVESWKKEDCGFQIVYIYKENGGMHTAHNTAYENITTPLNVCIDSDDTMAPGAVEKILSFWKAHGSDRYAGIIALDATFDNQVIGKDLGDLQETTVSGYYNHGGTGDKKLIYRTDIIKQYPPYPVYPGEKYFLFPINTCCATRIIKCWCSTKLFVMWNTSPTVLPIRCCISIKGTRTAGCSGARSKCGMPYLQKQNSKIVCTMCQARFWRAGCIL